MTEPEANASSVAAYYNEADIAAFYRLCWGGSDIHIGLYETGEETVAEASQAMTRHLLSLAGLKEGDRVLELASGYGGTLRTLAEMGCRPQGIDISKVCVEEARRTIDAAGLSDQVSVALGDFHRLDIVSEQWDACICQDAIIHSSDRPQVFGEAYRILKPGGVFAVSDIVTAEGADLALVDAAFARLGVRGGATAKTYETMAIEAGFEVAHQERRPQDIQTHYAKLAEQLANPPAALASDLAQSVAHSVERWRAALAGGHITWACFIARKPA